VKVTGSNTVAAGTGIARLTRAEADLATGIYQVYQGGYRVRSVFYVVDKCDTGHVGHHVVAGDANGAVPGWFDEPGMDDFSYTLAPKGLRLTLTFEQE
jgi:hypothetical protein